MMSLKKLTLEAILKTHEILMVGAVSDDGSPILNGKFRTLGVNNGVDNYMSRMCRRESGAPECVVRQRRQGRSYRRCLQVVLEVPKDPPV